MHHSNRIRVALTFAVVAASVGVAWPSQALEWEPEPSLNTPRSLHAAAVDPCGNIYVMGGHHWSPSSEEGAVEKLAFDGSAYAGNWVYVSPMPTPRSHHAAASLGGIIYVIGGTDGTQTLASVHTYDVITDEWSTTDVPDLNVARSDAGATVDTWGRIYVVGGSDAGVFLDSVEVYDPARPSLGGVLAPDLNEVRSATGAVTDRQRRIYAIGGHNSTNGHLRTVERFDPCNRDEGWVVLEELIPEPACEDDEAVLGADGRIYVAGGWAPGTTNRVARFDTETETWAEWEPLSQGRGALGLVLGANGRIFAIGGSTGGPYPQVSVESLQTSFDPFDSDGDGDVDLADFARFASAMTGP